MDLMAGSSLEAEIPIQEVESEDEEESKRPTRTFSTMDNEDDSLSHL